MKKFMAVYIGTQGALQRPPWSTLSEAERKARQESGMQAWMKWGADHAKSIAVQGGPLGKTKRVSPAGVEDIRNNMAGFVIVEAESHEAAAKLFKDHPHFSIFPGDSVEIMECLPIPTR